MMQWPLSPMWSRFKFLLLPVILTFGSIYPTSAHDFVQPSTSTAWTPLPVTSPVAEPTAREREVRRIVEEVLAGRDMQSPMPTFSEPNGQCEDCFSLSDFVSQKLTVNLGGAGSLKLYGYGRGDLILTTSRLNNAVVPFYALSEDPRSLSPAGVPIRENDGEFNTNVRLTRVGLDYDGPHAEHLSNAKLDAKIEIDFETLIRITSESRAVPRIRLAYAKMTWDELSILAGQDWDIISPLLPMINDDSLMWFAGNLGDRRPMLRTTWNHELSGGDWLKIDSEISSGGAIDGKDLDGNGIKDGEDSGYPAFQGRIGYSIPNYACEQSAEIGAWGFASEVLSKLVFLKS